MLTLLEQIDKGTLWRIPGGIHPPEHKSLSNQNKIAKLPLAAHYVVPVPGVGETCTLAVKVGDTVAKGQVLTQGEDFRHLPVHAPVSGKVTAIEARPSNHASALPVLSCVIENDHQERWIDTVHAPLSLDDVAEMDNQAILSRIQAAGIAGLGGAAFPTHIKLTPVSDIELLIINGVECEPYITSDDKLMQEECDEIIRGIEIIHQLLGPKRIIIAIEDNKPEAIEQIGHSLNRSKLPSNCARVAKIPTLYPSGGEKQLIQILTGQEVPSGAIPANLGILVQNVGTAYSIAQAVYRNMPLLERVVTLTGQNVSKPGNYWVPIGTPVAHLLKVCQFKGNLDAPVIVGGPMMGYMLPNWDAPITKGTNCLLMPSTQEIAPQSPEQPCIRCGECAVACPAQLLPQQLFWHAKAQEYDKAASYNLRDCIECGCCSYVCPSDIPLVEYYRVAKSALKQEAEEKKQAELAKQRFDSRTLRLEQEKQAREEKAKQAAERRKTQMTGSDKDAVAAAMARIKAKKADQEQTQTPEPTQTEATAADSPVNPQEVKPQDKVAAAIARAKAKKAAQKAEAEPAATTESSVTLASGDSSTAAPSQKEKVAAAIARAKAKKAAQQQSPAAEIDQEPAQTDKQTAPLSQQEKVAAAIARAKAKKAQQAGLTEQLREAPTDTAAPIDDAEAIKKAKIAAAVAKAKAKKAQQAGLNQEQTVASAEQASDEAPVMANKAVASVAPVDDAEALKKAKIAAAVAKAKAKKAQQAGLNQEQTVASAEQTSDEAPVIAEKPVASVAPVDDAEAIKKAKIAAAVAKAKAKKAQQAGLNQEQTVASAEQASDEAPVMADKPVASVAPVDDAEALKKAKIAAAVAKAKAKKLAKAQADNSTNEHKD
ncbi:electron transport complex subunit RsxC [Shewanella marisflavi]|uniref:Ion-translocating oxidoreductase complex subunit C n=1 Tax=Shewanella marisflavi TaxID=260364 RepID=A0AAC9TZE2_9GAMM|nr:electron transport complex subunit RsxC [Shewanella marisflavi]ASJ96703.1 electron transport complex subunit RsxC [Shewanella marisflavi]